MAEPTFVDGLSRVMPTVFVAGPAKSGSTFLWECIHQSFHPQRVCGSRGVEGWSDAACGGRRFALPALSADTAQPACYKFSKESSFWRYWGRRPHMTWTRYGGPRLPMDLWALDGASCQARRRARFSSDQVGVRSFAGHRAMEDACLRDMACPVAGGRVPYDKPLPSSCLGECKPCTHHPGWVNNVEAPCAISPYRCASLTCAEAPYVPKVLRRQNYSHYHTRAFSLTAYPSLSALSDANVTSSRLSSIEGNPGIFQTPPRHARALAALTTPAGRHRLRLIIGLRDPFDLAFSL